MSGNVVLLIDESAAMDTDMARPMGSPGGASAARKSKMENVATAINSLLNNLADGADIDVAVVGYRSTNDGTTEVGCRWSGQLEGRQFVPASELRASPATVEQRTRKIPGAGGFSEEETVDFPIWYQPETGDKAPQIAAFEYCAELLSTRAGTGPSIIINIFASSSSDGNPLRAIQAIQESDSTNGAPIVVHAHLGSSDAVPATLFPANRAYLKHGSMRDIFERASQLPEEFIQALTDAKVNVNANAKAMIYNAKMIDLGRLFALVRSQATAAILPAADEPIIAQVSNVGAEQEAGVPDSSPEEVIGDESPVDASEEMPEAAEEDFATPGDSMAEFAAESTGIADFDPQPGSVNPDQPTLVMFVLDRSLEDPYSGDPQNAFTQLRDHMSELVGDITRIGEGSIDVGVVSYGADSSGEPDIRTSLEGGLEGRPFARDDELQSGAVRDESYDDEMSNGVGGIIKIHHLRLVLVETEPTSSAPATPAFAEVSRIVSDWCTDNPESSMPPVILHLTRGRVDAADATSAVGELRSVNTNGGLPAVLYHLVVPETEHLPVMYAGSAGDLEDSELQTLWGLTSPLLCRSHITADDPSIAADARGMVVNGKFNRLLDAIRRAKDE